ncbi:helix-turn-helix domain-containing protein [Rhodopseudomonas palustris]|uniref:helix-turn-helix domain-containing protein n=1 Tax=Rhodopseudomonas palustris TaxID=1076 RepID=UPI002ACE2447|nr:helix-turn-helix domain-containing protein [Rhodopseudomonas palustris]WQH01203.1 helix-turn-helix domain-containing protein [Rhodopseudomonas palustris]
MQAAFSPQPHRTVDSFQTGVRQVCGGYAVRAASFGDFPFTAWTGLLRTEPGIELAYVRLSGVQVERTPAHIRSDSVDHFVLTMQFSGEAEMMQGTGTAVLRPDDIFVSDATRPSRFSFASGEVEQVSFHIPRTVGLGRFGKLLDGPSLIRGDSGFAIALKVLLQRLTSQIAHTSHTTAGAADAAPADPEPEGRGNETSERLEEAFFSVLASALMDSKASGLVPRETHDRLYEQALCIIQRQAHDPGFGAGQICRELAISPRQLQRSFARHGDSAREQILSTRLERARRRILSESQLTVGEIAYASGFNDLSFFYRAYRRHFGAAPGERR